MHRDTVGARERRTRFRFRPLDDQLNPQSAENLFPTGSDVLQELVQATQLTSEEIVLLGFTSGTIGEAKGVLHTS